MYLDADTLVVNRSVSIFDNTPDDVAVQMCRFSNIMWQGQPHYNSGVIVVNSSSEAEQCFEWVLNNRTDTKPHHVATFWEQNFILDYVFSHPDIVSELGQEYNFIEGLSSVSIQPVIRGFHGKGLAAIDDIRKELDRVKSGWNPN